MEMTITLQNQVININRYLRLMKWAKKRYTVNGELTIFESGNPSVYTRIERAAFERYFTTGSEK